MYSTNFLSIGILDNCIYVYARENVNCYDLLTRKVKHTFPTKSETNVVCATINQVNRTLILVGINNILIYSENGDLIKSFERKQKEENTYCVNQSVTTNPFNSNIVVADDAGIIIYTIEGTMLLEIQRPNIDSLVIDPTTQKLFGINRRKILVFEPVF